MGADEPRAAKLRTGSLYVKHIVRLEGHAACGFQPLCLRVPSAAFDGKPALRGLFGQATASGVSLPAQENR